MLPSTILRFVDKSDVDRESVFSDKNESVFMSSKNEYKLGTTEYLKDAYVY